MSNIKYLENPAQFLLDNGLLFEINRTVLHPHGLALAVTTDEDTTAIVTSIWDYQDEEGGMAFSPDTFKEGQEKYSKFLEERKEKLEKRKEILGYVLQVEENE